MTRSIVLLSGGISSAVMLAKLVREQDPHSIEALLFDYEHSREPLDFKAAQQTARNCRVGAQTYQILLHSNQPYIKPSDLLYMIAQATRMALIPPKTGPSPASQTAPPPPPVDTIHIGLTQEHVPDEFIRAVDQAIMQATMLYTVRPILTARFAQVAKHDIIQMGHAMNVDFRQTFSCFVPVAGVAAVHCGTCPGCKSRRSAFKLAGVDDPTRYHE